MQLTRRVALNGQQLDAVDSRIVISSVEPQDGRENITAADTAAGFGQRITGRRRSTLDIIVKFRILEKGHSVRGLQERESVLEAVNGWAYSGGWLTLGYKPGRQICVIPVQLPGEGDLRDYTKEFQITFRAYGVPYWQQDEPNTLRVQSVSSLSRNFGAAGNQDSVADVVFTNTSGNTINTFSITIGPSSMSFTSLGLAAGEALEIDHTDDGKSSTLRIRIKNTAGVYRSAMAKRTGSDDLVVNPGTNAVTMSAARVGTLLIRCAGRFA